MPKKQRLGLVCIIVGVASVTIGFTNEWVIYVIVGMFTVLSGALSFLRD